MLTENKNALALQRAAKRYFYAAAVYLSLGALLGAVMMWFGNDNFQFLHSHMLLVGALLFSAYGAGNLWIASRAERMPTSASFSSMAVTQFWLANIGLPGMLIGSVIPVGIGLDRLGVVFGSMEAAAAVMYGLMLRRVMKTTSIGNRDT